MTYLDPEERRSYNRAYHAANRAKILARKATYHKNNKGRRMAYASQYRTDKYPHLQMRSLIDSARNRAKKRGIPFDLGEDEAALHAQFGCGVCSLSGLPFKTVRGKQGAYSPSIDRIQPKLGYVAGNVRLVLFCLNAAVGSWGLEETIKIMRATLARLEG